MRSAACKYTSVLPLPVTPNKRLAENSGLAVSASTANCCSWFRSGLAGACALASGNCVAVFFKALSSAVVFRARRFFGQAGNTTSPIGRW